MKPFNFNFNLDPDSKIRLYFQLYTKFEEDIKNGTIPVGTKLPSVRVLSQQLDVSRNTVTKAYQMLEEDGFIKSEEKKGCFASLPDSGFVKPAASQSASSSAAEMVPTVDSILSQFKPSILENVDNLDNLENIENLDSSEPAAETLTSSGQTEEELIAPEASNEETPSSEALSSEALSSDTQETETPAAHKLFNNLIPSMPDLSDIPDTPASANTMEHFSSSQFDSALSSPLASQLQAKTSISKPTHTENKEDDSLQQKILESYTFVLKNTPEILQKFPESTGEEKLKASISSFMKDFRNIDASSETIVISSSAQQLVQNILSLPSISRVTVKSTAKGLLQKAELTQDKEAPVYITPLITFTEGTCWNPEELFLNSKIPVRKITARENESLSSVNSEATLSYVSPIDIPLGYYEHINNKRQEMLDWANEKDYRYLIEYDSSNYSSNTLSFKCFDQNDKVIYLNSFSKLISTGVNGAWAILPEKLAAEYKNLFINGSCSLSVLDQYFLAQFIDSGALKSHIESQSSL